MTINHMPDANAKAKELSEGEANDALLKVKRDSTSFKECSRSILELPPVVLEEIVALVLEDLSGRDRLNALFRVSYTSKYIYAIMHGASRLWAFVDSELAANVNEQLIRKSGSAPLTIICRSDMKREFDEWGVIERERSRWKELKIVDRTLGHCSGWDSDYVEALSRLQLVSQSRAEDGTKHITISGIDTVLSLDMEDIGMPVEQLRILSNKLKHLRLRIHREGNQNFLPLRDLLAPLPNLQTLSLTSCRDRSESFPDFAHISPISFPRLETLRLMKFQSSVTFQLLISIKSPVLKMVEVEATSGQSLDDLGWIYERTGADSAFSIFLSQFRTLSIESNKEILRIHGDLSSPQRWKDFFINIKEPGALVAALQHYLDGRRVSNLNLAGWDTLTRTPSILESYPFLENLTLIDGGQVNDILLRMAAYNSSEGSWCLPRLQWLTILDCGFNPLILLECIRARYSHSSSESTRPLPLPLLYLKVSQLRDHASIRIKPEIKEEVRSILGKDKVEWRVEGVADSRGVVEEDSEIESDDEGKTQPWRRRKKVSAWRDYGGGVEVPRHLNRRS